MSRLPETHDHRRGGRGGGLRGRLPVLVAALWALGALPAAAAGSPETSLGLHMAREPVEAPAFTLRDLDGKRVSLGEQRGRLVFLNFFATWCGPCRQEMPAMERLHRTFRDRGLVLLALNLREPARAVRPFVRELALSFPVLLDADGRVAATYVVRGLPATYFIGRDGRMLWRAIGPREWDGPEARAYFAEVLARTVHEKP